MGASTVAEGCGPHSGPHSARGKTLVSFTLTTLVGSVKGSVMDVSFPVTGIFAYLIVRGSIPLLDWWSDAAASALPDFVLEHFFNPVEDRLHTFMMMNAFAAYVVMAMGVFTVLDLLPYKYTARFKVQGHKSYFTPSEWLQATGMSLVNMAVFSHLVTVPIYRMQEHGTLRGGTPVAKMTDEFELLPAMLHFLVHGVVIEVWFYWTHYALHLPVFYKAIHKFHHRFKAPTAVACMYANPIEFLMGNATGVVLGPMLTNCHPYTAAFWMAFSLIQTSMGHSGYAMFGAEAHDQHHEHFDYNFGVLGFMDTAFGTSFAGSDREQKILARQARKKEADMAADVGNTPTASLHSSLPGKDAMLTQRKVFEKGHLAKVNQAGDGGDSPGLPRRQSIG